MNVLQVIVRQYKVIYRQPAESELDWFRQQPNLKSAVVLASLAIKANGKRFSHQRRLKKETLEKAKKALQSKLKLIENCRDFDELHNLVFQTTRQIDGIGELYVYDTALRIGAKINSLPQKIYLHTGTRIGAKRLNLSAKKYIEVSKLPVELQVLEPHEIEDVLCIFKDELAFTRDSISKHSWCS